jgi:hypothetical protein
MKYVAVIGALLALLVFDRVSRRRAERSQSYEG